MKVVSVMCHCHESADRCRAVMKKYAVEHQETRAWLNGWELRYSVSPDVDVDALERDLDVNCGHVRGRVTG